MEVTSIKAIHQQEKQKFEAEINKIKKMNFGDIDKLVEEKSPKVLLKIILKILLYILKKI